MNDTTQDPKAAAHLAGYTCIAQHAAALTQQHKRLILPARATAQSNFGAVEASRVLVSFVFDDGSELRVAGSFMGPRIDAYWSEDGGGSETGEDAAANSQLGTADSSAAPGQELADRSRTD